MFKGTKELETVGTNGRLFKKRVAILECDSCGIEFQHRFLSSLQHRVTHFRSRQCAGASLRRGLVSDVKRQKTWIQKYGVRHPSQLSSFQDKRKDTSIVRYGDLFHKTDAFKEKRCSVMTLRYGMQYQQTAEFKKRRLMSLKDNGNYNGSSKGEL